MTAGARVIELVGQDQRVIVAKGVEGPDGIRIVRPALVAGDVSLDWPGLAAIPGLVEAEKMVVAFGANDPLAGADQVFRVGGIDPDVRLRMILDQHRRRGDEAGVAPRLARVGSKRLARRASRAGGHPGVSVVRTKVAEVRDFGCVATCPLGGREDIRDVVSLIAVGVGLIGLGALWDIAHSGARPGLDGHDREGRGHKKRDSHGK